MVEILIWVVAIFAAGSFLVLERRCLGQRALVQPLALCLIAGWVAGNPAIGLWLGVSLQLLSVAPSRTVDFAFCSAVASATLLTSEHYGFHLDVGCPEATALMFVTIVTGMIVRTVERRYAKQDRDAMNLQPPWLAADSVTAIEHTVYRATRRWFLLGGLEVVLGLGIALLAVKGASYFSDTPVWLNRLSAVALPTIGAAVAVSVLTGRRFIIWAGASTIGTMAFLGVVIL